MPLPWINSRIWRQRPARFALLTLAVALAMISQPPLTGCTPAVIGGAAVGAAVIHDRRPSSAMLADQRIELQAINRYHGTPGLAANSRIAATSYNRILLLTGQAPTRQARDRYANLVSRLPEVRKVINQISIGPKASLKRKSEDAYLTSRVKVALASVDIAEFDPTRVKVVTESGTVHLLGILTEKEATAVVDKVRQVPGVIAVVKLFELFDPAAA